jgi:hypothetical protein
MRTILEDASKRPELFHWNGPPDKSKLKEWIARQAFRLPSDLVEFWRETGGGEAFESETFLGPFGDSGLGDDVMSVNAYHRAQGLRDMYLIFHVGLGMSAVRLSDLRYVSLDPSYRETSTYASLDAWYSATLRGEYAERYGL